MTIPSTGRHYRFDAPADGVVFAESRNEGTALSNAGIIDLGDETLVFDTSYTLQSARELFAAAASAFGRSPGRCANSHWHLDHILGNQVFTGVPIHATKGTADEISSRADELRSELSEAKLAADIAGLETLREQSRDAASKGVFEYVLRLQRGLLADSREIRLTSPTVTFEGEFRLPGSRSARLISLGAGHTSSDSVLFLDKERILFTGDLALVDNHLSLGTSYPEHWLTVLDRLQELRPEIVVPGHGPIGTIDSIRESRAYLEALLALPLSGAVPPIPAAFRNWSEMGQYEQNISFLRSRAQATGQADRPRS